MKIQIPDSMSIYSDSNEIPIKAKEKVTYKDITIDLVNNGITLEVFLSAENTPISCIRLDFYIEKRRTEKVKVFGDSLERSYGDMCWSEIDSERFMPWVCAVSNSTDSNPDTFGRYTECFGVKVCPNAICYWTYTEETVSLYLDVRCGGEGVVLGGRKLAVCNIVFSEYRNMSAYNALREHYKALCDSPLIPNHRVFGTNNWYYAYGNSSEEEILADTELLCELCSDVKEKPYMVIDDGWSMHLTDAPWDKTNDRFSDMKVLADKIKAKGARPGIWFRPFIDSGGKTEIKSAACRTAHGTELLDPSHPEVLEYVAKITKMLTYEWGYELIKHDYSFYDIMGKKYGFDIKTPFDNGGWHFYNRGLTTAEVFINAYRTIYEAASQKSIIIGCNAIGHLCAGFVHLNRTGDDTSGIEWDRTKKFGVNTMAFRMLHHEAFYHADFDCVGITEKIPWEKNREWLNALAASGTPLFVSPQPSAVTDEIKKHLRKAFLLNSENTQTMIPIDWMEKLLPEKYSFAEKEMTFKW